MYFYRVRLTLMYFLGEKIPRAPNLVRSWTFPVKYQSPFHPHQFMKTKRLSLLPAFVQGGIFHRNFLSLDSCHELDSMHHCSSAEPTPKCCFRVEPNPTQPSPGSYPNINQHKPRRKKPQCAKAAHQQPRWGCISPWFKITSQVMLLFHSLFFFILPFYTQNFKHSIVCFMMPFIVLAASAVPHTEF